MINKTDAPPLRQWDFFLRLISAGGAAFWLVLIFSISSAQAATPAANSSISNQASASYTDATGANKTILSNEVFTTVTQVAALDLTNGNTKTVVAGGTAYMPHTLTNLGNGSDAFTLPLVGASGGTFSSLQIFLDADGNGVPDSATPLCGTGATPALCANFTTPSILAGGTYKFVVALQVPAGTVAGAFGTTTVTAKSVLTPTVTNVDIDTVNVTTEPAFNVTKTISTPGGAPSPAACNGTDYSVASCKTAIYTLSYTNTGATGNLYLEDVIGSGTTAGMEYIAGTAVWSGSATGLTDAASGDPTNIDYQTLNGASVITTSGAGTIKAVIANVASGGNGTITFRVGIKSTAAVGISQTSNTAKYGVETLATVSGSTAITTNTNSSSYAVTQSYSVVANNLSSAVTDESPDSSATGNNLVTAASAAPGSTVVFDNYIWNTGTGTDTFDITLSTGNFPTGTTFEIFKADGVTPLSNSAGSTAADTGPLAAGASYKVVVKAIIPVDACSAGTCPTGPFTVDVTATSAADNTKSNKVFDQLTAISAPTVDVTNSAAGTSGSAPNLDPVSTTATTTNTIAAGATTTLDLFVKNRGSSVDNYNLEYSSSSNFSAGTMPVGWTVSFRTTSDGTTNGACSATSGSAITNTGSVAGSNGQVKVCAIVTAPANATAGTTDVYFKAVSGATGAFDVKHDAVTISNNAVLSLTTPGNGQLAPGASVVYLHDLTNSGNLSCGGDFTVSIAGVNTGWSVSVYHDNGGTAGVVDGTDTLLVSKSGTSIQVQHSDLLGSLAIGSTKKLLVKIIAPAGAASGDSDSITISVVDKGTSVCTTTPINDVVSVVIGQLLLDKLQANDVLCDGNADGAFVSTGLQAKPGECLIYKVTGTVQGTASVTAVTLNDSTPTFTTYQSGFTCSTGAALPAAPAAGYTGGLSCGPIATMAPGASAGMTFVVKVNP
jgi:uncharacterized membrane protein